jgi:hypothetical protein
MTHALDVIAVVGRPSQPPAIDAARRALNERSILGGLGYGHGRPQVAALRGARQLDAEKRITETVRLGDAPTEFLGLSKTPGDDTKDLVDIGRAS